MQNRFQSLLTTGGKRRGKKKVWSGFTICKETFFPPNKPHKAVYYVFLLGSKIDLFARFVCDFIFELPCTSVEDYAQL